MFSTLWISSCSWGRAADWLRNMKNLVLINFFSLIGLMSWPIGNNISPKYYTGQPELSQILFEFIKEILLLIMVSTVEANNFMNDGCENLSFLNCSTNVLNLIKDCSTTQFKTIYFLIVCFPKKQLIYILKSFS